MDYSEMKATKENRSDKLKNALGSVLGSDSGSKKTTKSTSSKKSTSSSTAKRGRGRPKGSKNKTSKGVTLGTLAGEAIKEIAKSNDTKNGKSTSKNGTSTKNSQSKSSSSGEQTKYDSMKATKVGKTDNSNFESKVSSSTTTRIVKSMGDGKNTKSAGKKKSFSMLFVFVFFVIGIFGGFFGCKYLTRNDVYEMVQYENGEVDVVIEKDGEVTDYVERGVKCIAFGKDYSENYTVKYYYRDDLTNDEKLVESVDENTPGIYYAVYEVPTAKYKTVKLIRNIIVLREEDNG